MPRLLQRYATPLITGLFLVSLVSGTAMFFGLGGGRFGLMHEWLSMVLILPFVLHLWRNWRSLMGYLGRTPMTVALAVSAAAAVAFALNPEGTGRLPPHLALARVVLANSPEKVAPLLGVSEEDLTARLTAAGFEADGSEAPLAEIARGSGKTELEMFRALLPGT